MNMKTMMISLEFRPHDKVGACFLFGRSLAQRFLSASWRTDSQPAGHLAAADWPTTPADESCL